MLAIFLNYVILTNILILFVVILIYQISTGLFLLVYGDLHMTTLFNFAIILTLLNMYFALLMLVAILLIYCSVTLLV